MLYVKKKKKNHKSGGSFEPPEHHVVPPLAEVPLAIFTALFAFLFASLSINLASTSLPIINGHGIPCLRPLQMKYFAVSLLPVLDKLI